MRAQLALDSRAKLVMKSTNSENIFENGYRGAQLALASRAKLVMEANNIYNVSGSDSKEFVFILKHGKTETCFW